MRPFQVILVFVAFIPANVSSSDDKRPEGTGDKPKVVTEQVRGGIVFPAEKRIWTRITGKVTVVNAYTLRFEDGTEVCLSGTIDAPELNQKALIGESFYPCGKEATEFLRKLIGDQPVIFFGDRRGEERVGKNAAGSCFVGETNLEIEMVRSGWALSHHSRMDAWEIIARENKRGLWRGKFVVRNTGARAKGCRGSSRRLDTGTPCLPQVASNWTLRYHTKVTCDGCARTD